MMFHGSKEYKETLAKRIELDPNFSKKQKNVWECQNVNVEGEALEKTAYDALKKFFQGDLIHTVRTPLGNVHKGCPIFLSFFEIPTYPCPFFSYIPKIGHPTLANIPTP